MRYLFCLLAAVGGALFAATDTPPDKEIVAVMDAYKDAMIHNDAAVLEKLLHNDLSFVHSAGQLERKADVLKSVTSGKNVIIGMCSRRFGRWYRRIPSV